MFVTFFFWKTISQITQISKFLKRLLIILIVLVKLQGFHRICFGISFELDITGLGVLSNSWSKNSQIVDEV